MDEEEEEKVIEIKVKEERVANSLDISLPLVSISSLQANVVEHKVPLPSNGDVEHIDFMFDDEVFDGKEDTLQQVTVFFVHGHEYPSTRRSMLKFNWFKACHDDGGSWCDVTLLDRVIKIRGRIFSKKGGMMKIQAHKGYLMIHGFILWGHLSLGLIKKSLSNKKFNIEEFKPKMPTTRSLAQVLKPLNPFKRDPFTRYGWANDKGKDKEDERGPK